MFGIRANIGYLDPLGCRYLAIVPPFRNGNSNSEATFGAEMRPARQKPLTTVFLGVQTTQIWSIYGFQIRNRNIGFDSVNIFPDICPLEDQMNHKIGTIYHILIYTPIW